ncbi:MAG: hypothetical protein VB144_13000 [Clostridia bacterium]|nr:hypothetical protein [Clostridia bacterium]
MKRAELGLGNCSPVGSKAFAHLDQAGIITLRFPVDDASLAALIGRRDGQNFVFINTAIPLGKQYFAAAHELCHAWYDDDM